MKHGIRRRLIASSLSFAFGCGGGGNGPTPAPSPLTVTGRVTNRIDGAPVPSSKITFRGVFGAGSGQSASVAVTGGTYEVRNLTPGAYEVVIEDASHVSHKTVAVDIPTEGVDLRFSVIGWNTPRFGAAYDATFDGFYRGIRGPTLAKWNSMPTQIYVEDSGIDSATLARVLAWLREINTESVPAMFCGLTGALPIETGPPLPGHEKSGAIVIWFGAQEFNQTSRRVTPGPASGSTVIAAAGIHLIAESYIRNTAPEGERCVIAHELFHAAYANHSPAYQNTLMRENCLFLPRTLSAEDRLASCLVYHPDTHAGNLLPDTNPGYR